MAVARYADRYVADQPVTCSASGAFRPEARQIGKVNLIDICRYRCRYLPCVTLYRSVRFEQSRWPAFVATQIHLKGLERHCIRRPRCDQGRADKRYFASADMHPSGAGSEADTSVL